MVSMRLGNFLLVCNACLLIHCPQASADNTNGCSRSYAPSDATITRKTIEPTRVLGRIPQLSLVPIAHVRGEIFLKDQVLFGQPTMSLLKSRDIVAEKGHHESHLVLANGSLLLAPKNRVDVTVPNAEINIEPGAIVYIRTKNNNTAVLNLHDERVNAVNIKSTNTNYYLPPGRVMLITDERYTDFDNANPCPGLWYRSVFRHESKEGITRLVSQFSPLSAAWILPCVRNLILAKSSHGNKIIKTGAAVTVMSRDRKDFRYRLENHERSPVLLVSGKLKSQNDEETNTLETWKTNVQGNARGDELISLLDTTNEKLAQDATDADSLYMRGYLYGVVGCTSWAIQDLTKAIERNEDFADAYKERGICYMDTKNFTEALKDLNHAIELDPNSGDALLARGRLYLQTSQPEAALTDLLKCTNEAVSFTPALPGEMPGNFYNAPEYYLSSCYKALGEEDKAKEHLERAQVGESQATVPDTDYLHRFADRPPESFPSE